MSAGAFLPPALQQAWEDMGVTVLQGYGATETGTGSCTTLDDHGLGHGRAGARGHRDAAAPTTARSSSAARRLFKGYWNAPEKTAESFTEDGWYRTGDVGHFDGDGRLILSGRKRDMIVLPNGFNVYPEDIENALRIAGLRDTVVLETEPGRIEAILLVPGGPIRQPGETLDFDPASPPAEVRATIDAAVKAANATLGPNQRIAGWRLWHDADFPRTHTLKIKRDLVRAWAAEASPAAGRGAAHLSSAGDGHLRADAEERLLDLARSAGRRRSRGSTEEHDRRADDTEREREFRRKGAAPVARDEVGLFLGCRVRRLRRLRGRRSRRSRGSGRPGASPATTVRGAFARRAPSGGR